MSSSKNFFSLDNLNIRLFDGTRYILWRRKILDTLDYMNISHIVMDPQPVKDQNWADADREARFLISQYLADNTYCYSTKGMTTAELIKCLDDTFFEQDMRDGIKKEEEEEEEEYMPESYHQEYQQNPQQHEYQEQYQQPQEQYQQPHEQYQQPQEQYQHPQDQYQQPMQIPMDYAAVDPRLRLSKKDQKEIRKFWIAKRKQLKLLQKQGLAPPGKIKKGRIVPEEEKPKGPSGKKCSHCKRIGHTRQECWYYFESSDHQPFVPQWAYNYQMPQ